MDTLKALDIEAIDIGQPGLLSLLSDKQYSIYNTLDFNIKTSFKWLALLGAMSNKLDNVLFIDSDIKIISPLPFDTFSSIWENYDIIVQDEGISTFPKHPCTGFVGFKFGQDNLNLLDALHKQHTSSSVSSESQHDQSIFFEFIARDFHLYQRVYFLPQRQFPVGYMAPIYKNFSSSKISICQQDGPVLYHANWAVGIEEKAVLMDSFSIESQVLPSFDHSDIQYSVGDFTVVLPHDHLLPHYQHLHPKYDKFLPLLARYLPNDCTVIDVGANCGDTLAGMASMNHCIHYICIEPDETFFAYLEKNAHSIQTVYPEIKIHRCCELVGFEVANASLVGNGGTKSASINSNDDALIASKTLDDILGNVVVIPRSIKLLKIDTDGFDYDVLMSASDMISSQFPLLFFECQHSNISQFEGFTKVISWLSALGYCKWFIFDNFGGFLLSTDTKDCVIEVMEYVHRQNQEKSTRTMYYVDIFAVSSDDIGFAERVVKEYSMLA